MSVFYTWSQVYSLADSAYAGTYTKIATIPKETIAVRIATTLDGAAMLSLDTGVTDHIPVNKEANYKPEVIQLALQDYGYSNFVGKDLMVKDLGSAPTTGSIYVTFLQRA